LSESEIKKRSGKWLDRVGLSGFGGYYSGQMSGGMQQRVGLARALATDADILLMDEPFSALDPLIRTDMQELLLGLQEELQKTIIFITHDLHEGLRIGDSIAILRDGVIVQNGTPQDILLHPAEQHVSDFTKDINRGRVLKVSSIMEAHTPGIGSKVDQNMVIEDALVAISAAHASSATVTCEGKPVGSISLEKMISALAKSHGDDVRNRQRTH
jgi:glycine betaine/proline transport system ATP-binding protein